MFANSRRRGFTLIELAVVLTVVGLLLTAFLRFYQIMDQKQRIETTRERLQELRTSLIYYVLRHNRLPCPASPLNGRNADREKDPCGPDVTGPPAGVTSHAVMVEGRNVSNDSANIWAGVVPVRDLQLDPQLSVDGWGNRFSYAVSRNLTLPQAMHGNPIPKGHISVVDENGDNLLETPDTGRYVVISHGPSGSGAWTREGKRRPCQPGTLATKNCENTGAFVMAPFSTAPGERFFDNLVINDDVNAGGTLLDHIAICTRKLRFFEPGEPTADRDGCVQAQEDNGAWHGMCLKTGDPNSKEPVRAIMRPAIVQGGGCGCLEGLGMTPKLAGSWLQAPEIDSFPPGTFMMSLYTCVRQ
jgi:prepilin-type N-terminal cleavage/methylation domain-containing protein